MQDPLLGLTAISESAANRNPSPRSHRRIWSETVRLRNCTTNADDMTTCIEKLRHKLVAHWHISSEYSRKIQQYLISTLSILICLIFLFGPRILLIKIAALSVSVSISANFLSVSISVTDVHGYIRYPLSV
ncbi:hypothetical protein V1527DRAFT_477881 [Lipomyces starkeyi]